MHEDLETPPKGGAPPAPERLSSAADPLSPPETRERGGSWPWPWPWAPRATHLLLGLILIAALWLRLFGPSGHAFDWGSGQFLHPDENFVGSSLVGNLRYPSSPFDLFNSDSGWNPAVAAVSGQPAVNGHPAHDSAGFNYGSLPLYLIKIFMSLLSWLAGHLSFLARWQSAGPILYGRILSGIFDTITVWLVFLLGRRTAGERAGLFAATLACFAVLSMQLAHYTTVDSFLGTFATGTVLASVTMLQEGRRRDYAYAGIWLAAALATKVSAAPLVATVVLAILCRQIQEREISWKRLSPLFSLDLAGRFLLAGLAGFIALFFFQPYTFVDWAHFQSGVLYQNDLASGNTIAFYTIKWHGTAPLIYPLIQLANYSLGLPLALAAGSGLVYEGVRCLTRWRHAGGLVAVFVLTYFVSAGLLYMKYLRYMEPIAPSLCVLAALLISALASNRLWLIAGPVRRLGLLAGGLVLVLSVGYGVAYQQVYSQPLTRLQASTWIYQHLRAGTRIAESQPDETLPLGLDGHDPGIYPWAGAFAPTTAQNPMPTYDDDSRAKVQTMAAILANAQYYFESSRRAIETFQNYGDKYPYMQRFYALLLAGKLGVQDQLGYTLVARFVEHPRLGPWTDTEQGANQNFNEYDHPPVEIFQNTGHLNAFQLQAVITDRWRIADPTLASETALMAPAPLPKSLLLSAADLAANQHAPTYAAMFPAGGLPMRFPIPAWWLMIELLGLLALPISMRLFSRLGDCGFVLAKTVGILLLAWFAWILPSLHLAGAEYSRTEIALCLLPVAAISLAWGVRPRDILPILRVRRRAVLLGEGAFLAGFAFFVWIRALYPDLWHPFDGGEKTMDMSFLNAIVRSRALPPLDPWYGGGYLNYYYYGHFTVATLLKLIGITPAIAINLALPTFFALALASCVSLAYSLARRLPVALAAGALGLLAGNLYGAEKLVGDLQAASPIQSQLRPVTTIGSDLPILGGLIDAASFTYCLVTGIIQGSVATAMGIGQVLLHRSTLPSYPFRNWAWDGSRAIDNHAIITEFPFWTFLYADPHAHLWDMPFALCIVAVAFNLAHGATGSLERGEGEQPPEVAQSRPLLPGLQLVVWPLIGILLGAIGPTNTWDFAAMFGILSLVIAARSFWQGRGWLRTLWTLLWQMLVLAGFALGCYLPFYMHFQSFYSHIGWTILRHQTPIGDFATHFGLPLYILIAYLPLAALLDTNAGLWLRLRLRGLLFTLYYWDQRQALPRYFALVRRPWPQPRGWRPYRRQRLNLVVIACLGLILALAAAALSLLPFAGLALLAAAALILVGPVLAIVLLAGGAALVFLLIGYLVLALLAAMGGLTLLLLVDRRGRQTPAALFFHLVVLMGLVVAAAAEIVYVRDFYDGYPILFRSNTVFKLYEDAWLLLSLGAAVALVRLLVPILGRPLAENQGVPVADLFKQAPEAGGSRAEAAPRRFSPWAWAWLGGLGVLILGAAIYPLRMTPERLDQRSTAWPALAAANIGLTLDGMAFLKYVYPDDYAAIQWINNTIPGSPVMLTSRYGNYGNFSARVGMFTGLPTLVDWGFEAAQQRYNEQTAPDGRIYPEQIGLRERTVVDEIYSTTDTQAAISLLHQYHVAYVYVGVQERGDPALLGDVNNFQGYPAAGLAKFPLMAAGGQFRQVYAHGSGRTAVRVYQVLP